MENCTNQNLSFRFLKGVVSKKIPFDFSLNKDIKKSGKTGSVIHS